MAVQDEINERVMDALTKLEDRIERHDTLLNGNDPTRPGLAMRVDRIEQLLGQIKWIGRGGLVGLIGTLVLLWKILATLSAHGPL